MEDPDNAAGREAAAVVQQYLAERNIVLKKQDAHWLTTLAVAKWVEARCYQWSLLRPAVPPFPGPDPELLGFSRAALKLIADKLPDAPWDKPIGEWSADQAAMLFATGYEAIEARRIHTLEDPNEEMPS